MSPVRNQRGISLISLLVGLVVSLTATVGLLSIYRNSLQVTTSAQQSSVNDSQLASLLLRTGAAIQDAGYGITTPAFGTQIIPISGATLNGTSLSGTAASTATAVNGIVWATLTGASTQCAGFVAPAAGGLIYLQPAACNDATTWSSIAWQSTVVASQSNSVITFTVAQQSCQPYGIPATTGKYTVNLNTTDSIGAAISSLQCLINFQ
jgi:Tfp pilus assembly protein PilW